MLTIHNFANIHKTVAMFQFIL